jgi:hypothetical protein
MAALSRFWKIPAVQQSTPRRSLAWLNILKKLTLWSCLGDQSMKQLFFALASSLALVGGAATSAKEPEPAAALCDLPAGWSDVAELKARFVVFGELHGTNEGPSFVGSLACALTRENNRVLVAIEHNAVENEALQSAWSSDDFEQRLSTLLFAEGSDGRSSLAMFDLLVRLHRIKQSGAPLGIVAFNGFRDEQQAARFSNLTGQGPWEAAQAENIATASTSPTYDHVLVLVGNIHAMKTPVSRGGYDFDPMALRLSQYGKTVSLNMRYADGTSWNCLLKPGVDRTKGPVGSDDIDCGPHPTKGEPNLGSEPFIRLEKNDGSNEQSTFDGFFWVGAISASVPKSP